MENRHGQIITFYSYKGGTGRSMALANIACILAERQAAIKGKGVLMIDWDLEAPGLHRYFHNRLVTSKLGIERVEKEETLDAKPGLIDLFVKLDEETERQRVRLLAEKQASAGAESVSPPVIGGEELARATIGAVDLQQYILSTNIPKLNLIKAGCFNPKVPNEYSQRVNKFSWEALYRNSPQLIRMVADTLAEEYAYVLIDSRTGITDISGVCTMILPETLVVVFTPNMQSTRGALDLIKQATDYRKESSDLRPLVVFPLVSRVENSETTLKHDWRFGNEELPGYQPQFEKLLADIYDKEEINFKRYFDEIQVQHMPRYAYGEEIAVLVEKLDDRLSLRRSYQTFAKKLTEGRSPWEGEVERPTTFSRFSSVGPKLSDTFLDTVSLSRATRLGRSLIVVFLLAAAILASVIALRAFTKEQRVIAHLQKSQMESEDLRRRVNELEDPYKAIIEENNSLKARTESLSYQLQAANEEVLVQTDNANKSKLVAERALSAQKASETARQACESDSKDTQSAYNDALRKYSASQVEVRRLQDRVAKCGCNERD